MTSPIPLTPEHLAYLTEGAAITPEVISGLELRSAVGVAGLPEWARERPWAADALPAIVFPWRSPDGRVVEQVRPDRPLHFGGDDVHKYLWPSGESSILNAVRVLENAETVLIVEGTKQALAAASWAPEGVAVYGIGGCRNWSTDGIPLGDLSVCKGRDVVICLDADVATNLDVYKAAERLGKAVKLRGAKAVAWADLGAGGTNGLDDVLATLAEGERTDFIAALVAHANPKKPSERKPAEKKADKGPAVPGSPAAFFEEGEGLLVQTLSEAIRDKTPAALTEERKVALYRGGVYHIDGTAFAGTVAELLGEKYRPAHRSAAEEFTAATLFNLDAFLPIYNDYQLLNVPGGMLDLATGTLKPHDPSYFSTCQIPVAWDPDAKCPTYERWVDLCGIGDQIDDLEECTSAMLDPSRTPSKAVFLFGPSRSGKSTFLRLMRAIAGARNTSAVTLHQLTQNRFAAANVFGKMLNSAADLSAAHVEDISIFKMMTGEDAIQADRKYGGQFAYTNRALFAFSANELPTVGESSRAYVERIKPFDFPISFAGREDPSIEFAMMRELPGILARWVRAWQRRAERGRALETSPAVMREFETRSDRVRQWLDECCDVWDEDGGGKPIRPGVTVPATRASTPKVLVQAFNDWARDNHAHGMGSRKVLDRLRTVPGVMEVRVSPSKVRGFNVTVRKDDGGPVGPGEDPLVAVSEPQSATGGSFEGPNLPLVAVSTPETATESQEVRDQVSAPVAEVAVSSPTSIYTHPTRMNLVTEGVKGTCFFPYRGVGSETAPSATPATALFDLPAPDHPEYERSDPAALDPRGAVTLPDGVVVFDLETAASEEVWDRGPEFVRLAGWQTGDRITLTADPWEFVGGPLTQARTIVGHNVMSFDLVALAKEYGVDLVQLALDGSVFDTMLAAVLNDPPPYGTPPEKVPALYSLNVLGDRILGQTKTDDLKRLAKEFGGFDRIPLDHAGYLRYLIGDVDLNAQLAASGQLRTSDYVRREHRIAAIAAQMRLNGFRVDVEELHRRIATGEQDRARYLADLTARYGLPTTKADGKPSSRPHQTKEGRAAIVQAFRDLGVELPLTDKGNHATDKAAMGGIVEAHVGTPAAELAGLIQSLNGIRTVYETVADYLHGDRVHPEIGLFQASGRWSTTKPGLTVFGKRGGKHVERGVFLPEDGHVLISADLAQIDARAIAALSQDPAYLAMFEPGIDLHTEVAMRIWGDPKRREDAKARGHGWNYGMGVEGMVRGGVPREVAQRFDDGMREQFPTLCQWRTALRRQAEETGTLDNGFGRLMRVDPARAWTQAPALMGQGCARDLMMEGLLRLPREVLPMLRAVVHDEVIISVPLDVVEDVERTVLDALSFDWAPPGAARTVHIEAGLADRRGHNWGDVYEK